MEINKLSLNISVLSLVSLSSFIKKIEIKIEEEFPVRINILKEIEGVKDDVLREESFSAYV